MNRTLVGSLDLSKQILQNGWDLHVPIMGMCMYPFFKAGNNIIVKSVKPSDTLVGDIILFWFGESMKAHRLLKKYMWNDKIILLTKGDSSISFDHPIYSENLLGKIVAIEKGDKKIIRLDHKIWRVINYLLAVHSLTLGTFIRDENNNLNIYVMKIIRLPIIFLSIIIIDLYFVLQKCKRITKLITLAFTYIVGVFLNN